MKKFRWIALLCFVTVFCLAAAACGQCKHTYVGGVCTACGEACEHVYVDGTCTKCETECAHEYADGVCEICEKVCAHEYVNGTCTGCNKVCTHTFVDGTCSDCGKVCVHRYDGATCTLCGKICSHNYVAGVCSVCSTPCAHESYENGACKGCGKACEHNYEDSVCTICGVICSDHAYLNGICGTCGKVCAHSSYNTNGFCKVCGKACSHENWVNGTCTTCGKICTHDFKFGVCLICDKDCPHHYNGGICVHCGGWEDDYTPSDGGVSQYAEVVAKYKYLVEYKHNYETLPPKGNKEPVYVDALYEVVQYYDPSMDFGYAYQDLDNDDCKELILLNRDSYVYGIFTIDSGAPVPVCTFQKGQAFVCADHSIYYYVKAWDNGGGQIFLAYCLASIVDGQLVDSFTFGWEDQDKSATTDTDTTYFKVDAEGNETELTKDEYRVYSGNVYDYYVSYGSRLGKSSNLRFYPVMVSPVESTVYADFSTYDKIVETFTYMNDTIGKYEKSSWSGGKYDNKMLFDCDEDFEIYNRIVGACALLGASNSTYGYAQKDINADGTPELILLDSNYSVIAIFTMKEGKAVLVDTFNDRHYASIDASGNVYVVDRQLPGNKKDYEYSVCTLVGDKLVLSLTIGIKHQGATTTPYAWYKVADGVETAITEDAFNSDFATYFTAKFETVNASNFAKYTKDNAGLTFVGAFTPEEE